MWLSFWEKELILGEEVNQTRVIGTTWAHEAKKQVVGRNDVLGDGSKREQCSQPPVDLAMVAITQQENKHDVHSNYVAEADLEYGIYFSWRVMSVKGAVEVRAEKYIKGTLFSL